MINELVEILLVEDDAIDAELTIRELRNNNLTNRLLHVKNGAEAINFLFPFKGDGRNNELTHIPKLILLDIHMPKVNGLEVLDLIKKDNRTKSVPVVMLTSSKESPDIKRAYQLGANSYIVKPVQFEDFQESIKKLGAYWLILNQSPEI